MKKLQSAFDELENVLLRNIANHIISYEFHATATEEELVAYYGGGSTNRERLLADTLGRLYGDQQQLKFLQANKGKFKKTYGDKDPAGDIGITLQRSTGVSIKPEGGDTPTEETGADASAEPGVRPADDADEGDHSSDETGDIQGDDRAGGDETDGVPADDGGKPKGRRKK